ncbi:hypothetical protein MPH_09493 [Macrophomina phaseolina MS6]|uniref:Uncharacterized protein n=1 Tax=Macrophomina phaseolina (strain MS6) TaxID=1126212 RepID=K2RF19_MACPH|nr:hypothetical protein MPH_09493 [Macrophomina phaseolina MS6]
MLPPPVPPVAQLALAQARESTSPETEQNAAKKPARKRKRKPRPPPAQPGLRWLNSTDPSQFRDDRVRKAVRSHVMYDHAARKKSLSAALGQDQFTVVHLYKGSQPPHHHERVPLPALAPAKLGTTAAAPDRHPADDGDDDNYLALTLLDRLASHLDPLGQLPGFAAPRQHVRELQKFCVEYFATTIYRVAPIENSNVFLAGMCMASSRLDVLRGLPRESAITAAVKLEAVRLLNQSLGDPNLQLNDETIMILTRLLHSEVIHGNFAVLEVHKRGMERIVQLRGGFQRLFHDSPAARWLCNAIVHVVYQACIHTEQQPSQIFLDWVPPTYDLSVPPEEREPAKQMYLPDRVWTFIVKDYRCSKYTAELLNDLRDATGLFLTYHSGTGAPSARQPSPQKPDAESLHVRTYLMQRIASKPSAEDPESPVFGDWYYESVRILSHIYATAIYHMVPFSVAAILAKETLLPERLSLSVPERLKLAIEKTHPEPDFCWGPLMTRVLLWICVVGGAAANPFASEVADHDVRAEINPGLETSRRYLISLGLRSTIVLACQSPYSPAYVLELLRRVILVQGLFASGKPAPGSSNWKAPYQKTT